MSKPGAEKLTELRRQLAETQAELAEARNQITLMSTQVAQPTADSVSYDQWRSIIQSLIAYLRAGQDGEKRHSGAIFFLESRLQRLQRVSGNTLRDGSAAIIEAVMNSLDTITKYRNAHSSRSCSNCEFTVSEIRALITLVMAHYARLVPETDVPDGIDEQIVQIRTNGSLSGQPIYLLEPSKVPRFTMTV